MSGASKQNQSKAARQRNKESQMMFDCIVPDSYGPDGSLCVWSAPATVMMKMLLFSSPGSQSATLPNMLVHKNLLLCLAVH